MKPLKSKVSITLDEDVIERIKQLAESDDRSFSQYINMVLKDYLNKVDNNGLLNSSPFIFDIDFRYIPSDSEQPLNMAADIKYILV